MLIGSIKYFTTVSGILVENSTGKSFVRNVQLYFSRSLKATLLIFVSLTIAKLIQLVIIEADPKVIYACTSVLLTNVPLAVKVIIFEKNDLSGLFREVLSEETKLSLSPAKNLKESYKNYLKLFIKTKNSISILSVLLASSYYISKIMSYPKASELKHKNEIELLQLSLMYPLWFPFKECNHLLLAAILNIPVVMATTNLYLATQFLPLSLMTFTAAQLKSLQVLVKDLGVSHNNFNTLRILANNHLFIIRFVNKVNAYTSYVMLTNFIFYSVNCASVAMEIIMANKEELAAPIIAMLYHVMDVFLLGWFANEVMVQSLALGNALYQTEWYNLDVKTQKLLLVIIRQTQTPLTLSIGPFGPMTLQTALKIMQASYSYVMVMKSF